MKLAMYDIKRVGWSWQFKTILSFWLGKALCQNVANFSIHTFQYYSLWQENPISDVSVALIVNLVTSSLL